MLNPTNQQPPLKQAARTSPIRWIAIVAVCAFMVACGGGGGPGTGGTGGGPLEGVYAISASVSTINGVVPTGANDSDKYRVTLDANGVHVLGSCLAFDYTGAWRAVNDEVRIDGLYRVAAAGDELSINPLAKGSLLARTEAAGLSLTIQRADGSTLISFTALQRVTDTGLPAAPPACVSLRK
jgi:hypothetical protein